MNREIRCPDCHKRLFDLLDGSRFRLVIVCRCKKKFLVDSSEQNLPSLVRV